ncbi:calcium uptake protein, mitochondrial-like isoform X2 [Trifolium pratense]|uniref:calcium uptake protein, mitochondrial-like isoform X2 n=1 Tax=Trifolium pratense TaxID=57577 RepID=UPI001E6940FB|nr:calcium uptake protein, mitochondrial-like isoform X2 [Trifolium pratense]
MSLFSTLRRSSFIRCFRTSTTQSSSFTPSLPNTNPPRYPKLVPAVVLGSVLALLYYVSKNNSHFDSAFLNNALRKLSLSESTNNNLLFGDAYRSKVFFNYENRIRLHSPPEKVFEYFASCRTPEPLMTPADLMRAVVPVFPPSESNLVREGHLKGERSPGHLFCPPSDFFMLFDVNGDGLISFREYLFLVTLLSIPESSFSAVFKMFDMDNDGRHGVHRRDERLTDASIEDGRMVEYLFGKDGKGRLKHDKFVKFISDLHDEILRLEFVHYDFKSQKTISAKDFAHSIVASADVSHLNKLLERVDEMNDDARFNNIGITFEEFKNFAELRKKLVPLSLALFSFAKVNGLLTRDDFQRAASSVCGLSLSNNVVEIVFHLFDTNGDGNLCSNEFVRVLHRRERDVGRTVETGIIGFLSCCWSCTDTSPYSQLFS